MSASKSNWVELVRKAPKPRKMKSVARVTIKGMIRRPTMAAALIAPRSAPARTATARPPATPTPASRMAKPAISGARYMTLPTERSMPAVSSTKVMPIAAMPMKADCLTMLARLSGARKPGVCTPNQRSTARKIRSVAWRSARSERRVMRRPSGGGRPRGASSPRSAGSACRLRRRPGRGCAAGRAGRGPCREAVRAGARKVFFGGFRPVGRKRLLSRFQGRMKTSGRA